jgi:beta-aspartyl-peptidase (threonine type)
MESRIDSSAAEAEQKAQADTPSSSSSPIAIVIHGGAGTILKKNLTDEMQAQYHATLKLSVETGHAVLKAGGAAHGAFVRSCLSLTVRVCGFAYIYIYAHTLHPEAVVAAIEVMEESVLFNAGRGGVFCHEGHVEHDASIMRVSNV